LGGVAAGTATVIVTAVTGVNVLTANALPFLVCLPWILAVSVRLGGKRVSGRPSSGHKRAPIRATRGIGARQRALSGGQLLSPKKMLAAGHHDG
jgi:hypothetical protein